MIPVHSFTNLSGILAEFSSSVSSGPDFSYMPSEAPRASDEFADFTEAALDLISTTLMMTAVILSAS